MSASASTSSAPTHSVTVSGLAPSTTKEVLEHFFSFCGKIVSISHEGDTAKIEFAKESAAKTSLMLTGGVLEGKEITVSSDEVEAPKLANVKPIESTAQTPAEKNGEEIEQEDKPHSAKIAEYLAHGYAIGDATVAKAIEADKSYGISQRFLSFFNPLKEKAQPSIEKATQKLHEVDEKQGLSLKAKAGLIIGSKYYTAALNSPFGHRVHSFYTTAAKQVTDVHEEALRIKSSRADATAANEAPLPSTGTAATTDATGTKPLESTAAPLEK
ncbi:hypothetical protein JCM11251_007747 [Rhodosporidiobolus azoricus]